MEYIVIRDRKTMSELARCKAMGAGPFAYGNAAIIPIIDKRNLELWVEDAAVASTYILLAAEYCGVAACWIQQFYAINGSPRKTWNTAQLLDKALEGAKTAEAKALGRRLQSGVSAWMPAPFIGRISP